MSKILESNDTEKDFMVSLPQNVFADIIINFLGKKETTSANFDDSHFVIGLNEIKQFYYLLFEKLEKEQNSQLSIFYVSISYDDGTVKTINTFESLDVFFETKNVSVVSITLSWQIIQKFPNSETFETQKIDLSFISHGEISLNIDHTNKSWANEVEFLFTEQIKKTMLPKKKVNSFIKGNYFLIFQSMLDFIIFVTVITLIISVIVIYTESNSIVNPVYRGFFSNDNRELFHDFKVIEKDIKEEIYRERNIVLLSLYKSKVSERDLIIYLGILNDFGSIGKKEEYNQFSSVIRNIGINNIYKKYIKKIQDINLDAENRKNEKYKYHSTLAGERFYTFIIYLIKTIFLIILMKISISSYILYYKEKSFILLTQKSEKEYDKFNVDKKYARMTYRLGSIFFIFLSGILINIISSLIIN